MSRPLKQLFVAHGIYFNAGHSFVTVRKDAEIPGYSRGCDDVISRDHDRLDPCLHTEIYRIFDLRSRRVYHSDQSEQSEVSLHILRLRVFRDTVQISVSYGYDSERSFTHSSVDD